MRASAIGALVQLGKSLGNLLEVSKLAIAHFEELDLDVTVQVSLQRNVDCAGRVFQCERLDSLREMYQQAFSRGTRAEEGHAASMRPRAGGWKLGGTLGGRDSVIDGVARQSGRRVDIQLAHNPGFVKFDRFYRDFKKLRDLFVLVALRHQPQDF